MTKRYQYTRLLVELRENVRQFPTLADEHIHNTIIESLSEAQRELWRWMLFCESDTITAEVVATFDYTEQYANCLLKELHEFGLLEREKYAVGNGYIYRVKGVKKPSAVDLEYEKWEESRYSANN